MEQFADEFSARWCARVQPCCAETGFVYSGRCGFHESWVEMSGIFTEELGQRCLDEIETGDVCSADLAGLPTCASLFPKYDNPLVADLGEPCNGTCNHAPGRANTCLPAAFPFPPDAEECQNRDGNYCDDATHTCVPVLANGDECTHSFQCASPSYCRRDSLDVPGTCQPQEPAGTACSFDIRTCDNFSRCLDGTCVARLDDGEACDHDIFPSDCLGLCSGAGVCEGNPEGIYYTRLYGACVEPPPP